MTINPMDICQMGPPDGRFCGFKVMYTYNKETLQCDEFWFPGCTTADTNANLFIDMQSSLVGGPSPTITSSGSGDGEDLGLLGLIQQGIQNANAIRQGGPQGKQAAAAAAGQILQQFTGFDLNNLGGNFGSFFGR
ncbi:Kunitz/Bovine pancreatic trypsin inhibitor domain protein [Ancylostoma caninum]|uniref:Kunitz/Bovine pancreatic trypsin inhibitor domain protein n=1 Tax=Ancylostoma caninum TaxID=29170 RepID=A0A368FY42_ANCCA|nr:Kunitz/Bovine pancreatic trypsin inhibitor domain protein [Ancylostoma caninum]